MSSISYHATIHHSSVRLTRRGRLVVFALALLAVLAIAVALASASAAGSDAGQADVRVVTVQSGDTLWDIAGDAASAAGVDTGDMVQQIEDLNTLDDGVVYTGQQLRVPAS